jgi:predicted adenine nucleotide alpha hydrolase (AANH) superfamily ATPase
MEKVPYIVGEYDVNSFYVSIAGLESTPEQGAKCSKCYDMRLERTALEARNQGFDFYATTLAISPHKVQRKLIAFGELNQKRYGVEYYHRNFMKGDGFKRSVELTEAYEIYRQDYCGCYFSLHEGGTAAQWLNTQLLPQNLLVSQERPYSIAEETFASYQQLLKASLKQDKNLPRKG